MIGLPALPQHSGALRAREAVVALERPAIANHSFRTYVWALLAGEKRGMRAGADFDADLLFYACVLHDLGTADAHDGPSRFEVEGADAAAELLAAQGVGSAEIDQVWEAIALHTSPHIAERRGPLALLTRLGVLADFQGPGADHSQLVAETERAYPRLDIERELTDAVVSQALRKPEKAPEHSWPGGLLRARLDAAPPP
ncbi:HD domain-containing protein [Streptomyces sp. DW26H14]|uniref:HD domain-containing protein n=1 Tax=Streptomyces sp. DW26H14 TaxID=3435395 RepID=UPI00403E0C93